MKPNADAKACAKAASGIQKLVDKVVPKQSHQLLLCLFFEIQVFSPGKKHALYLWIHLKPNADAKACAKAASGIQKLGMSLIKFYIKFKGILPW